jgi:EmrB/QacA subfamily drug resistance transporter
MLSLTVLLPVFGKLCDRLGVERVFTPGYLVFSVCSMLCGMADSIYHLILFRVLQGIGGAMLMATSAVVVVKYIPENRRGSVFGINGMMAGIGLAIGAPLGGWLYTLLSWKWIFFINIPFGIAGFVACRKFLNRKQSPLSLKSFDLPGAILLMAALSSMVILLSTANIFAGSQVKSGSGMIALACLAGFAWWENRASDPLLHFSLLRNRPLFAGLIANFFYLFILYGITFVLPFFFKYVRGDNTVTTSHFMMIFPVASMIFMPFAGRICDWTGTRPPALFGMTLFAIASAMLTTFNMASPTWYIITTFLLLGLAIAFFCTAILAMIMTHARPETTGMLSSLKAVFPIMGGLLGVTAFADIFSHGIERSGVILEHAPAQIVSGSFTWSMYLACAASITGLLFTLAARPDDAFMNRNK